MSDRKLFPHPLPPYRYTPRTLSLTPSAELKSFFQNEKNPFFSASFALVA
jgi:hypothetical protein